MMNYKKLLEEKLREAACFGDLDTLRELVLKGVDINSKNDINGWTALHWAACRGNIEAVSILLNNGADPKSLTHSGDLPCNLSASETVQALVGGKISDKKQSPLPITPNYLKNPPFIFSIKKCNKTVNSVNQSAFSSEEGIQFLIIKLRIADSIESDFIEIELQKSELTFNKLKEICCKELDIKSNNVLKIRKLPNTIVRNDKDVQRLTNFQELEAGKEIIIWNIILCTIGYFK